MENTKTVPNFHLGFYYNGKIMHLRTVKKLEFFKIDVNPFFRNYRKKKTK